jgi:hypothetical protein
MLAANAWIEQTNSLLLDFDWAIRGADSTIQLGTALV